MNEWMNDWLIDLFIYWSINYSKKVKMTDGRDDDEWSRGGRGGGGEGKGEKVS